MCERGEAGRTVLLTNRYRGRPLEIVQEELPAGFRLMFLAAQTQEALLAQAPTADFILAGGRLKITKEVLQRSKKLKMIQRSGVGLDALDLDAIKACGIPLYVNRGVNAESVAEHALLLILACLRRLPKVDQNTKRGIWEKQAQGIQTAELRGKTVGLIGMGSIARTLVSLLQPFQVRILYSDPFPADALERAYGLTRVALDTLYREADIVSIHCPLTEETRGLIDAAALERFKDGAILVNTARGEIVDPAAAAQALRSGKLAFAGLDVHCTEPPPADYPFRALENVILTPHIAGVTVDSFRAMMRGAFRNIACFDQGRMEEIAPFRYL